MVQAVGPEPEQATPRHGLARVMTNGELVYEDDYTPQSILLTGGCGFIGSHVAILLANKYPQYKVCPSTTERVASLVRVAVSARRAAKRSAQVRTGQRRYSSVQRPHVRAHAAPRLTLAIKFQGDKQDVWACASIVQLAEFFFVTVKCSRRAHKTP